MPYAVKSPPPRSNAPPVKRLQSDNDSAITFLSNRGSYGNWKRYRKEGAFERILSSANITVLVALSRSLCFINNIAPIERPINNIIHAVHALSVTYGKGRLTRGERRMTGGVWSRGLLTLFFNKWGIWPGGNWPWGIWSYTAKGTGYQRAKVFGPFTCAHTVLETVIIKFCMVIKLC